MKISFDTETLGSRLRTHLKHAPKGYQSRILREAGVSAATFIRMQCGEARDINAILSILATLNWPLDQFIGPRRRDYIHV